MSQPFAVPETFEEIAQGRDEGDAKCMAKWNRWWPFLSTNPIKKVFVNDYWQDRDKWSSVFTGNIGR